MTVTPSCVCYVAIQNKHVLNLSKLSEPVHHALAAAIGRFWRQCGALEIVSQYTAGSILLAPAAVARRLMVGGKIALDAAERDELQRRMRATTIAVRDRQRAEISPLPRA